jgi:hypothetical protein
LVRNFIKQTNLDTYECLCQIHDFVEAVDPRDQVTIRGFGRVMREQVDARSQTLRVEGERILKRLEDTYATRGRAARASQTAMAGDGLASLLGWSAVPYHGPEHIGDAAPRASIFRP